MILNKLANFWLTPCRLEKSEIKRAAAALSCSSFWATLHCLLTSHGQYIDRRDEHSWTKTFLNKTVQFARKLHAVSMLQREGEQLEVEGNMLEFVRPVLELLWVGWALGRDGYNSFLNPETWVIQVLFWSFTSPCPLHMHIHNKINFIINAFLQVLASSNLF